MNFRAGGLSLLALLSVTCWGGEPELRDFLGIIPDEVLELDAGTLDKIDAEIDRWDELDEVFVAGLAERVQLPRGSWEGFPEMFFFRVMLVRAAMNGEKTCSDRQRCAELDRGALPSSAASPQCSPAVCDRQHAETMASCQVLLAQRCLDFQPFGGKCEELKRSAYAICTAIADCQLKCCNRSCGGVNCALRATGKSAEPCSNCGGGTAP